MRDNPEHGLLFKQEPLKFLRVFQLPRSGIPGEPERAMEAVYFISAFLLLVALIYGTLNWHYRDKRRDRVTNQIVRDRYEHNQT